MSEEVTNQDTEVIENDNTNDIDTDIDSDSDVSDTSEEVEKQEDNEQEDNDFPTDAELAAMTDDEFNEFVDTGKIPSSVKSNAKKSVQSTNDSREDRVQSVSNKTKSKDEEKEIDYKAVYEELFKPFRANGKDIKPKSVEDIVALMQMGANYTKKMQVIAPMKRAVESLNKAQITEDDLNFLIDVHKGDAKAITKLLKKHDIDPLDLDMEEDGYVEHKRNIATDSDVEFADVLNDMDDKYKPKVQEVVFKKWDSKSRSALLNDPKLLRALYEEISLGRFDDVQDRVESERTFGRYTDVSDLEAYMQLVNQMYGKGAKNQTNTSTPPKQQVNKSSSDKSRATSTRGTVKRSTSSLTPKDILTMPEDEFNKLSIHDLV